MEKVTFKKKNNNCANSFVLPDIQMRPCEVVGVEAGWTSCVLRSLHIKPAVNTGANGRYNLRKVLWRRRNHSLCVSVNSKHAIVL